MIEFPVMWTATDIRLYISSQRVSGGAVRQL